MVDTAGIIALSADNSRGFEAMPCYEPDVGPDPPDLYCLCRHGVCHTRSVVC